MFDKRVRNTLRGLVAASVAVIAVASAPHAPAGVSASSSPKALPQSPVRVLSTGYGVGGKGQDCIHHYP